MVDDPNINRLVKVCAVVVVTIVFGTLGYGWLEGWSLADSLYMTVITMSTVGYGEPHELTAAGRGFTFLLIFLCIVSMTFLTATMTSFIVENDLGGNFQRRRTLKTISQLKNHTIICGSGTMAEAVIERLMKKRKDVVVIDNDTERLNELRRRWRKLLIVEGQATSELTLAEANVLEASHVVAALENEMNNLLVAITCKDIGNDIQVVARSNDVTIANRMRKANVDQVVSPSQIVGDHVAGMVLA